MACYHLSLKVMSRKAGAGQSAPHGVAYRSGNRGATVSSVTKVGGVSAVAAAAYRSGEPIRDERLGETYDYTNKQAILHTEIVLPAGPVPSWASDRNQLWNQVEAAEKRKDAVVAREVEVMLPRELTLEQQIGLVRRFIAEQFTAKGLVADFGIHRPTASDGQPHPHCHIMITPRALEAEGFAAKKDQTFWWEGKGDKSKDELGKLRETWAVLQNDALADTGSEARVDHRTLAAQRQSELAQASAAREEGRIDDAVRHEAAATALNRQPKPYVPYLVAVRLAAQVAKDLLRRVEGWAVRKVASAQLAEMVRGGVRRIEEWIASTADALERDLGHDPRPPDKGLAYER